MASIRIKVGKSTSELVADEARIGTHSSCELALEDRIASARHALVARTAQGWSLADLGSATGTWLNGAEVSAPAPLAQGDTIVVGGTRILVGVGGDGAQLELEVDAKPFHFEPSSSHRDESGKLVVGGDAERLVRDEVRFTRLRGLRTANLLALAASLLGVAALFVPVVRDEAFDPGPLAFAHARLQDDATASADDQWHARHRKVAQEQGCSACHDASGGTPPDKCAQCHAELVEQNHPFHGDRSSDPATASIVLDDDVCASCHMDHSGAAPAPGLFVPRPEELAGSCVRCHPDGAPELERKPASFPVEAHELAYDRFPHASHMDARCDTCHVRDAGDGQGGREHARVPFATCMGCHSADERAGDGNAFGRDPALSEIAAKVKPEHRVRLAWHGSQAQDSFGASRCLACHAQVREAPLRTVRAEEHASLEFALRRRSHAELFSASAKVPVAHGGDRACTDCHASGAATHAGETVSGAFLHALHVSELRPASDAAAAAQSAQCAQCHSDLAGSRTLAGGSSSVPPLASCADCHREERDGQVEPLVLAPQPAGSSTMREHVDFPHELHMAAPGFGKEGSLARGCYACHDFAPGTEGFDAAPTTRPEAASCLPCHDDHAYVGGQQGGCALCHPSVAGAADPSWSGKPAIRMREATRGFSHWSRGHAASMEKGACVDCHGNAATARSVGEMAIPSEADPACFDCHLRERFHWRGAPAAAAGAGR